jgi:hypothetical protein
MKTEKKEALIDNEIEEPVCSLQLSKELKEMGFNVPCTHYYVLEFHSFKETGIPVKNGLPHELGENFFQKCKMGRGQPHLAQAPTHSVALLWIKKNFGISLFPDCFYYDGMNYRYKWFSINGSYGEIWKEREDLPAGCDTIEEATEFALFEILRLKRNGEI